MRRYLQIIIALLCLSAELCAADYIGRVVDEKGKPVGYATVYMADDPVIGTATANNVSKNRRINRMMGRRSRTASAVRA